MQIRTPENQTEQIAPYNDVAELIDDKIHRKTLEQINFLAREYEIRNPSEVAKFLSENLFLLDLLREIPKKIGEFYGSGQKIALETLCEPDFPGSSKLWAVLLTELSAKEARSKMDEVDENWWLDNIDRANGKLNIGIDYV